ncbi:hypothetical protein PR048_020047 [Dryococelus australis]|uniref:Integrase zinc-binding domain-containing protein n=1 Tax=Dryococelus australis TaxID=614101 RepID=A0ABQ9H569_9NEOP|nr:hypothetical protein PR048_020047 [Dryococelus australis]
MQQHILDAMARHSSLRDTYKSSRLTNVVWKAFPIWQRRATFDNSVIPNEASIYNVVINMSFQGSVKYALIFAYERAWWLRCNNYAGQRGDASERWTHGIGFTYHWASFPHGSRWLGLAVFCSGWSGRLGRLAWVLPVGCLGAGWLAGTGVPLVACWLKETTSWGRVNPWRNARIVAFLLLPWWENFMGTKGATVHAVEGILYEDHIKFSVDADFLSDLVRYACFRHGKCMLPRVVLSGNISRFIGTRVLLIISFYSNSTLGTGPIRRALRGNAATGCRPVNNPENKISCSSEPVEELAPWEFQHLYLYPSTIWKVCKFSQTLGSVPFHKITSVESQRLRAMKGVICHINDITVFGKTLTEHDACLCNGLIKLQDEEWTLRLSKCSFKTVCDNLLIIGITKVANNSIAHPLPELIHSKVEFVLTKIHKQLHNGHHSIALAKKSIWWSRILQQLKDLIENCHTCVDLTPRKHESLLLSSEFSVRPWQVVRADKLRYGILHKKNNFDRRPAAKTLYQSQNFVAVQSQPISERYQYGVDKGCERECMVIRCLKLDKACGIATSTELQHCHFSWSEAYACFTSTPEEHVAQLAAAIVTLRTRQQRTVVTVHHLVGGACEIALTSAATTLCVLYDRYVIMITLCFVEAYNKGPCNSTAKQSTAPGTITQRANGIQQHDMPSTQQKNRTEEAGQEDTGYIGHQELLQTRDPSLYCSPRNITPAPPCCKIVLLAKPPATFSEGHASAIAHHWRAAPILPASTEDIRDES